jgi:hypothetical protein|tara:strand:+ start:1268 stop:1396 length:129 start_codon:yes stop_codon:yes gene_type:complete
MAWMKVGMFIYRAMDFLNGGNATQGITFVLVRQDLVPASTFW